MADLSDVEQSMLQQIVAAVYPVGVDQPSIVNETVKIYRGWPSVLGLNNDLSASVQSVTVFSDPKRTRETTRYPRIWREQPRPTPSLTLTVTDESVSIAGAGASGEVAGLLIDGAAFAIATTETDTPTTVAASFAALIPGASATGPTITISGASMIVARVETSGTVTLETRRQEQVVTVSTWCDKPLTRDALAAAIDLSFSSLTWVAFADGSAGLLSYVETIEIDTSENANLYRRDLLYRIEYPTIISRIVPAMMFGVVAKPGIAVETVSRTPILGAIRFDAWYDPTDTIDQQCAAALTDPQWSDRWPPNAVASEGSLTWPAATQATIDAEIEAAIAAGLNFWAFDSYAPSDGLTAALTLYLSSSRRASLRFCMLGQASNWADTTAQDGYAPTLARDVGLMGEAGYLTAEAGRPIYLVLDGSSAQLAALPDGVSGAIAHVRSLAAAAGLADPYIVWLSAAPLSEYDNTVAARTYGADAAAAYACPGGPVGETSYATLLGIAEDDWAARAKSGFPMLPTEMTGWDPRPLIETPKPFYPLASSANASNFYDAGTPTSIASHVRDLATFIASSPSSCPTGIGLIYAWNELAEGGWLMPTFGSSGPDTDRVVALGTCLGTFQRAQLAVGTTIA